MPALVSLARSNADAAPSTPLQQTNIHGAPLGDSVEVEVVDKRSRKGSERVADHLQVTEEGKGKVEEGAKLAMGDPLEQRGLEKNEGAAENYGVDVQTEGKEVKNGADLEKQVEISDGKVAARVDEPETEEKRAELAPELEKMEAEEKRLAEEEEKERGRAEEQKRVLESKRAQIAAARLSLKQGQIPEEQGGDKSVVGTSGGDELRQKSEHSDGDLRTKRHRDVLGEQSGSQTGGDEAAASEGDGTEGGGKKRKVRVEPDNLGKVWGVDDRFKAGGFLRRKKGTVAANFGAVMKKTNERLAKGADWQTGLCEGIGLAMLIGCTGVEPAPDDVPPAVYAAGVASALYTLWGASIGQPLDDVKTGAISVAGVTVNDKELPESAAEAARCGVVALQQVADKHLVKKEWPSVLEGKIVEIQNVVEVTNLARVVARVMVYWCECSFAAGGLARHQGAALSIVPTRRGRRGQKGEKGEKGEKEEKEDE
ncbi:unnamed protein product [Closterium sp. Naga37s-1]|nr:unnamed protein product [Closterium sp. Naga37s-1]